MKSHTFGMAMLLSGLILAAKPVTAHHSFAAQFDINKPLELQGRLTGMEWVNPHGWLYMDVENEDGTVTNWAVEAGPAQQLLRRGLREEDFTVGVEIIVTGYQARGNKPMMNGRYVVTEDGTNFYLGSSQQ